MVRKRKRSALGASDASRVVSRSLHRLTPEDKDESWEGFEDSEDDDGGVKLNTAPDGQVESDAYTPSSNPQPHSNTILQSSKQKVQARRQQQLEEELAGLHDEQREHVSSTAMSRKAYLRANVNQKRQACLATLAAHWTKDWMSLLSKKIRPRMRSGRFLPLEHYSLNLLRAFAVLAFYLPLREANELLVAQVVQRATENGVILVEVAVKVEDIKAVLVARQAGRGGQRDWRMLASQAKQGLS
jgi:hypothetical protein